MSWLLRESCWYVELQINEKQNEDFYEAKEKQIDFGLINAPNLETLKKYSNLTHYTLNQ